MTFRQQRGDHYEKQHLTAFWLSLLMTIVWVLPAFTIHAEAVQLLSIDVAAPMEVFQGESITVRASGSGGTAPYQYYFSYKINNGNWTTLRNYSSVSSVSLTTSTAGNYTMRSFVRGASVTAALARTIFPAGTDCVSHTLPPMMQSLPICVSPPRIVAPE